MESQFDIPKLLYQRKITNKISDYLENELSFYISMLTPLFHPHHFFGEYISGTKQSVKGAEATFKNLTDIYNSLKQNKLYYNKLDDLKSPMDVFGSKIECATYEYPYTATKNEENKSIRIISPLKWVLGFKNQNINKLRELLDPQSNSRNSDVTICVLHHLVLHAIFTHNHDIKKLFNALRFNIYSEPVEEFGKLPFIFITTPISTIRPEDELIIQSTELSGAPVFEEIINSEDINLLSDPYKDKLLKLLNNS